MTKTAFYERYGLLPDTGNVVNAWGAIQPKTGRYLLQCWDNEKRFIRKENRSDDAIMIVKLLSPKDFTPQNGAAARARTIEAIRAGAPAFVAVSTGHYPDWIESANIDQVYPVLLVFEEGVDTFAKVGAPLPTLEAFEA